MTIETRSFTDRVLKKKKWRVWWWFMNDDDPTPDDWYMPGRPQWWRIVCWYCRNPLSNFFKYVVGVKDRNFTIRGTYPVNWATMADVGLRGWKWSVISLSWLRLPFVSYAGKKWLFYLGWRYEGGLGFKFNWRTTSKG